MIVKYTFNDNDFTQVIEEYLNDFGPFYVFNYPTAQGLDEFKKLLEKYDDYNDKYYMEKDITKEKYKEIKKKLHTILKANIIQYYYDEDESQYIVSIGYEHPLLTGIG